MRPSEDTLLDTEDSRCGEIFVSNKADKWTFYCSYCQKGTSDIGVFVCHIRLDHLASLLDYGNEKENVTPEEEGNFPETETQLTGTLLGKGDERETDITLIKEETLSQTSFDSEPVPTKISKNLELSSLTDNSETENVLSVKQTSSSGFCSTQSEEFFSRKSGEPDPEQNVLQLNQKTNKTKRVPTKTTKLREDFARRSSDSEPDLKRFNTGQENEEFLSITNESNHVAQEIFIINSEDIDQETGCKTNKSNNETISIDAEKDFPTTTSSIHQKDEKITSESTNTEISMLKKLPLQQQQMRLSPDVIILEEVAETPDVTLESLGMPPINVEQTITSVMDQQQKDDISTEEHSAVTEKTSSDDSTNKRSIRMVNACSCCKDDNKDKRYKCALCELTFLTKNLLNIHIAETHKGTISKTRFECKDCCRSFGHLSALKYHLENFHKFLISRTNFKEYYLVSYGLVPDKIITQFKCQYCLTLQDIGRQKPPYICTNCGSSPKRYRTSFDSIPKAQIKTKRSLP